MARRKVEGWKRERRGGQYRPIEETGNRYGRWIVLERADNLGANVAWKCRCACGVERVVRGHFLRNGSSESCGCLRIERLKARLSHPAGEAACKRAIDVMKANAKRRGLSWTIAEDEARAKMIEACSYCGSPPSNVSKSRTGDFRYNGLDRVDSTLPYTPSNIVTCCFVCNNAKRTMTRGEFMDWIRRVCRHSGIA